MLARFIERAHQSTGRSVTEYNNTVRLANLFEKLEKWLKKVPKEDTKHSLIIASAQGVFKQDFPVTSERFWTHSFLLKPPEEPKPEKKHFLRIVIGYQSTGQFDSGLLVVQATCFEQSKDSVKSTVDKQKQLSQETYLLRIGEPLQKISQAGWEEVDIGSAGDEISLLEEILDNLPAPDALPAL